MCYNMYAKSLTLGGGQKSAKEDVNIPETLNPE